MKETLCWKCRNACGNCEWSKNLQPVDGWKTEKGEVSLIVVDCPKYKDDWVLLSRKRAKEFGLPFLEAASVERVEKVLTEAGFEYRIQRKLSKTHKYNRIEVRRK